MFGVNYKTNMVGCWWSVGCSVGQLVSRSVGHIVSMSVGWPLKSAGQSNAYSKYTEPKKKLSPSLNVVLFVQF